MTYEEALTYLTAHGQQHLLRYYPTLTLAQQKHLLEQISNLHLERPQFQNREAAAQQRGHFAPLGAVTLEQIAEKADEYRRIGLQAIRDAKVGAVLLAGGQGSRLGFDHPKGMYNMGKTRDLYIFECLIHNLKKVTDEAEAYVPLMIMTSEQNDAETRAFLKEHDYFGYSADNVHFFKQETEPAVDENGKLIDGDRMIAVFALDMKNKGILKDDTAVVTVMTNMGFKRFAEENGITVLETKVGDRYVLEEMLKHDYKIGGEQSGHIIFKNFATTGDGQLSGAMLASIISSSGKSASEIASVMTVLPQTLVNITASPELKAKLTTDKDIIGAIDEVKKTLGKRGRILVRASGTEPLIRVMLEGDDIVEIKRLAKQVAKVIEGKA